MARNRSSEWYLFTSVNHLLDDTLYAFKLGTHASAGTDGCYGFIQIGGLVGVRHETLIDRVFPLVRSIEFEL